jgi:hypothetical protein
LFPASRQLAALHSIVCPVLVFRKGILPCLRPLERLTMRISLYNR